MSQLGTFVNLSAQIDTLTGNVGGAVPPTGQNINIIGAGNITVTGNPGTSTLTITDTSATPVTVQTVDDTPTALYTYTLIANSAVVLSAFIVGAKADYSAAITGNVIGGARRAGGGTIMVGAPTVSYSEDSGTGTPSFDLVIVGNSLVIQVTGEAAITYNWKALVSFEVQS